MSERRAWTAAAVLLALFLALGIAIALGATQALDQAVLRGLRLRDLPGHTDVPGWLVTGARELTWLGAGKVRGPLAALGAVVLAIGRHRRAAAALLVGWAGESLLVEAIKAMAHRARPDVVWRLVQASETSFPSGHAAGTMLLYPLSGWMLGALISVRVARAGAVAGVVLAVLVGLTRVLLGVHWASDVAAGWLLGGAIAVVAATAFPADARRRGPGLA